MQSHQNKIHSEKSIRVSSAKQNQIIQMPEMEERVGSLSTMKIQRQTLMEAGPIGEQENGTFVQGDDLDDLEEHI